MRPDDLRVYSGGAAGLLGGCLDWGVAFLANELRYVWVDRSFSVAHSAVLAFRLKETEPGGMHPGRPVGEWGSHTRSYGRCLDAGE